METSSGIFPPAFERFQRAQGHKIIRGSNRVKPYPPLDERVHGRRTILRLKAAGQDQVRIQGNVTFGQRFHIRLITQVSFS